jgi:polar amino acid transport system substrate-binding protein
MDSMTAEPRVTNLVQAGEIRLALFLPQYRKDLASGEPRGIGMGFVAIEIARLVAARLHIRFRPIELLTPLDAIECIKSGDCDFACLGIEPSRAAVLDFSPPIIQFDYSLLVPDGSSIRTVADADRLGTRIAVVRNHASTLALSRIVKHAELVGSDLPSEACALLRAGSVDALAAPREHLLDWCDELSGSRLIDDGYGVNNVGIAVRKNRPELLAYLSAFVQDGKTSGLFESIVQRGGLRGLRVAP